MSNWPRDGAKNVESARTLPEPPRTAKPPSLATAALIAILVFSPALVKLIFYPAYPGSDDAFIHLAIAQHILGGDGWGVVSNDRVNLSSSPGFTLLLVSLLSVGSIGFAQFASVAFACAALATTFFAARWATGSTKCGVAALVVGAANVHLWRWSGTVMETSLAYLAVTVVAAVTLWLMQSHGASRWNLALLGALIAFGAQVRFEIALFLPLSIVALWFSWRTGRSRIAVVLGGFVAGLTPWVVFATAHFHTPIPTTFFAKASSLNIVNTAIVKSLGTVVASGFGVSLLIAVVGIALAGRSPEGRIKLRQSASRLLLLLAWPIALCAFYYVKTSELQSAARYFLPGMATWPIAVGLIIAAVPANRRYARWLPAALVGCLAVALAINIVRVQPVLSAFNSGYRQAMTHGAEYLRDHCRPGDVALIWSDIGILSYDGIGNCILADGAALATPELRGLTFEEQLSRVNPTYLVQSIGRHRNELAADYPQLALQFSERYPDHGVARAGELDYINIYLVTNFAHDEETLGMS